MSETLTPKDIDWNERIETMRVLFAGYIGAPALWLAERVTTKPEIYDKGWNEQ